MKAKIFTFSSQGDTTLLEYDPATADMDEVNRVIAEYEAKTGAQPFDMATGERIEKVSRQQSEVLIGPSHRRRLSMDLVAIEVKPARTHPPLLVVR